MDLYLAQHGEAKSEKEDPARPLTDRGRDEVSRVAAHWARAGPAVSLIAHSGKLRARQTAEILAERLMPPRGVVELPGLAPNDDPEVARKAVEALTAPTLLVGHLPHLSRLASLLVVGDSAREIIAFRTGGIVGLARSEGGWRVRCVLTPELA